LAGSRHQSWGDGMAQEPTALPRIDGPHHLTDGGLETTLVFHKRPRPALLCGYFDPYLATAAERGVGFILDTPTWRANPDWAQKLGYSPAALAEVNRQATSFARSLRDEHVRSGPILINGVPGQRAAGEHRIAIGGGVVTITVASDDQWEGELRPALAA
jgi:homocysteine S-methyltransferase